MVAGVEIRGELQPGQQALLSSAALAFLAHLHRMFEETRQSLLRARSERRHWGGPGFAAETSAIRDGAWRVAERSASAAGATLDEAISLEDAATPSLANLLALQASIGRLAADPGAVAPLVQVRGLHLPEAHLLVDGSEISASIFDFGLCFFHNAQALVARGAAPAFVLPKLEHFLEARLWANIFVLAQSILGLPLGSIRATILVETLPAAFMAEELLFELRDHAVALGFDREDYLFSYVKSFADDPARLLPDLAVLDNSTPLLAAAAAHLHETGRKRGVAVDAPCTATFGDDLAAPPVGPTTAAGLAASLHLTIGYLASWLRGEGRATIDGRTATTATAELCRAQLWQWRRHGAILDDGSVVTGRRINAEIKAQLGEWRTEVGDEAVRNGQYREAATILLDLVLEQQLPDFLTLPCYRRFLAGERT